MPDCLNSCLRVYLLSHVQLFVTPMGYSPPRLLLISLGNQKICLDFPGKNTGVGCHFLLQGIFLTQGLIPVSCISSIGRRILYFCATWEAFLTVTTYVKELYLLAEC